MSEIVNLNRARKLKARADGKTAAAENRVRHGRTKAEREALKARADKAARAIDGHRLSEGDDGAST